MALIDARILRTLTLTETKGDKGTIQISGSQEFLILADAKDPAFSDVLQDATVWPNIGNERLPQINDYVFVKGKQLYCTSRELSYYKENERAIVMAVRYDAKDDEAPKPPEPEQTDPATWQRITVSSQQITKPAVGWYDRALVPQENNNDDEGEGALNSAGDPIDGLEEEASLIKMAYTNTQVATPNFAELMRYTNRCNDGEFLGGADYTVRVMGFSAEYDQKNNTWSVTVEFLFNPDGWFIQYYDAGYNQIKNGKRQAIVDLAGNPVSKPVPLDGQGQEQAIQAPPARPLEPVVLKLFPYKIANLNQMFINCGI